MMWVLKSKPQTGSSLIPKPSFHGSLCPTVEWDLETVTRKLEPVDIHTVVSNCKCYQ